MAEALANRIPVIPALVSGDGGKAVAYSAGSEFESHRGDNVSGCCGNLLYTIYNSWQKATAAIATVALYEKTLLPSWPAPAKPAKCLLKVDAHGHSDPSQTFHTAWDLPA